MSAVGEAIDQMIDRIIRATYQIAAEGAELVADAARIEAPKRTDNLSQSIVADDPSPTGAAEYSAEVGPTAIYGRIVELGGVIEPHGHPYLAFYWAEAPAGMLTLSDGRVLAHQVHVQPHPYLKPAVEITKPAFAELRRRRWADAIRGVS